MAITVTVGGEDFTSFVLVGTLIPSTSLDQRDTCSFALKELTGADFLVDDDLAYFVTDEGDFIGTGTRPAIGAEVLVSVDGDPVFGGTVDGLTQELLNGRQAMRIEVSCVDHSATCDRHLVARTFEVGGQTADDVLLDIVAQELAGEGFDTSGVAAAPAIGKVLWNYQTVSKALADLAELVGYAWWVGPDKTLYFQPRAGVASAFSLTTDSANWRSMEVETTRQDYRNRQYVRGGYGLADAATETLVGDGTRKVFNVALPVGAEPAVEVNGVPKTVGIKGVETGFEWYWNKGATELSQDDGATAVGAGVDVAITYQGLFPLLVSAEDADAIAERAAAEGGSGLYEHITDEPSIDGEEPVVAKAEALLRRYGRIPRKAKFETDVQGLRAGQILSGVDVPLFDLAGEWLVAGTSGKDVDGRFIRWTVTILDGESLGGWTTFFAALAGQARSFVVRDNEVIAILRRTRETVIITDSLTYTSGAPATTVGTALVDFSEVG